MGDTSDEAQAEVSAIKEVLVGFDGFGGGDQFVCRVWLCSDRPNAVCGSVHIHTESGRGVEELAKENAARKLHASGWRRGMSIYAASSKFVALD